MRNLLIFLAAAVTGAVFYLMLGGEPAQPPVTWTVAEEEEVSLERPSEAIPDAEPGTVDRQVADIPAAEALPSGEQDNPWGGARVNVTLNGRVIDTNGQPVPGANVQLAMLPWQRGRGGSARRVPEPATTGADGAFSFTGSVFQRMRVSLEIQHASYAIKVSTHPLQNAKAGDIIDLEDITVAKGGTVQGVVTSEAGIGIPEAVVTLNPDWRSDLRWMRMREEPPLQVKTDGNGIYTLEQVPAGEFELRVMADGYQEGRRNGLVVADERQLDVDVVVLEPGFRFTGTVVDKSSGQPIAAATVSLRQGGGRRGGRGRGSFSEETDEEGRFTIDHLPTGEMNLQVRAKGYLPFDQEALEPQSTPNFDVFMEPGLTIQGLVLDAATGEPLESYGIHAVYIEALPSEESQGGARRGGERAFSAVAGGRARGLSFAGGRGGGGSNDSFKRARSWGAQMPMDPGEPEPHPEGRFTLDGLIEGVYAVDVAAPGYERTRSTTVTVARGQGAPNLPVRLARGVLLAGVVQDEAGEPIAGAEVQLRAVFDLDDNVGNMFGGGGPGAGGQGSRGQGGRGQGGRGNRRELMRRFLGSGPQSERYMEATSRTDGSFSFDGVPGDSSFLVRVRMEGQATIETEPFTPGSGNEGLTITLKALARLEGQVVGLMPEEADEARVYAIRVGAMGQGRRPFEEATPNSDGSYTFEGLEPGDYLVRASVGDNRRRIFADIWGTIQNENPQFDATLVAGEVAKFNPELVRQPEGSITGNVVLNGQPATGCRVRAEQVSEGERGPGDWMRRGRQSGTVDADGNYKITGLEAGSYRVIISSASGRRGATIHTETVQVLEGGSAQVNASVVTGSIQGTVTMADGSDLPGRLTVMLLKDATAAPEDLRAFPREGTVQRVRVRDGKFSQGDLSTGNWLLLVRGNGVKEFTQQLFLGPGETAVPVSLTPDQTAAPESGR